jgi:hypothetical protein
MFVPVMKACQMTFVLLSLIFCRSDNFFAILTQNFLMMLDLASETAIRTALTAILYLIASVSNDLNFNFDQGWGTLRTLFGFEDCDRTAKILGFAYFIHSAYFLTTFVLVLHDIIRILMMSFYLLLAIGIIYESRKSLRLLNVVRDLSSALLPLGQLESSLRLKR